MAQTVLGLLTEAPVFRCQNCREVINTAMTDCAYCGVAIDYAAAQEAAADAQKYIGRACNDARYVIKIAADVLCDLLLLNFSTFLLSFIPFLPLVGWATRILLIVVLVLLVRWWIKYRSIQTSDADYEKARRDTIVAAVVWSLSLLGWLALEWGRRQ